MIAPDLRGFGDSGLAPDDRYDAAAHARDMEALLRELGHERCVVCAGDLGGVVAQDMSLRFDGLVDRLVLFNTIPPILPRLAPRDSARDADGRRLLHAPVTGRRRARGGARHPREAARLRRSDVRAALLGRARSVLTRGHRVPHRAVRRRRPLPRLDRELRVRGRVRAPPRRCRGCSSPTRCPRWCSTAPRTT